MSTACPVCASVPLTIILTLVVTLVVVVCVLLYLWCCCINAWISKRARDELNSRTPTAQPQRANQTPKTAEVPSVWGFPVAFRNFLLNNEIPVDKIRAVRLQRPVDSLGFNVMEKRGGMFISDLDKNSKLRHVKRLEIGHHIIGMAILFEELDHKLVADFIAHASRNSNCYLYTRKDLLYDLEGSVGELCKLSAKDKLDFSIPDEDAINPQTSGSAFAAPKVKFVKEIDENEEGRGLDIPVDAVSVNISDDGDDDTGVVIEIPEIKSLPASFKKSDFQSSPSSHSPKHSATCSVTFDDNEDDMVVSFRKEQSSTFSRDLVNSSYDESGILEVEIDSYDYTPMDHGDVEGKTGPQGDIYPSPGAAEVSFGAHGDTSPHFGPAEVNFGPRRDTSPSFEPAKVNFGPPGDVEVNFRPHASIPSSLEDAEVNFRPLRGIPPPLGEAEVNFRSHGSIPPPLEDAGMDIKPDADFSLPQAAGAVEIRLPNDTFSSSEDTEVENELRGHLGSSGIDPENFGSGEMIVVKATPASCSPAVPLSFTDDTAVSDIEMLATIPRNDSYIPNPPPQFRLSADSSTLDDGFSRQTSSGIFSLATPDDPTNDDPKLDLRLQKAVSQSSDSDTSQEAGEEHIEPPNVNQLFAAPTASYDSSKLGLMFNEGVTSFSSDANIRTGDTIHEEDEEDLEYCGNDDWNYEGENEYQSTSFAGEFARQDPQFDIGEMPPFLEGVPEEDENIAEDPHGVAMSPFGIRTNFSVHGSADIGNDGNADSGEVSISHSSGNEDEEAVGYDSRQEDEYTESEPEEIFENEGRNGHYFEGDHLGHRYVHDSNPDEYSYDGDYSYGEEYEGGYNEQPEHYEEPPFLERVTEEEEEELSDDSHSRQTALETSQYPFDDHKGIPIVNNNVSAPEEEPVNRITFSSFGKVNDNREIMCNGSGVNNDPTFQTLIQFDDDDDECDA